MQSDLPNNIPAPASRALLNAKITTLAKLATYSEAEILALHGMGPSSLPILKAALRKKKLSLKK